MIRSLITLGAALLCASLSPIASAAVSVNPITIQCPPTPVGSESTCTVNASPYTGALLVSFSGSGTRKTDQDEVFTIFGATARPHFRITPVTPTPANACKDDFTYAVSGTCAYPNVITFKPQSEGVINGIIHFKWAPTGGCTNSCPEAFINISGTGLPTFTYDWHVASGGPCTGGSGEWQLGVWTPSTGCGLTTQTRTSTCITQTNSGELAQTVTCVRSDGAPAQDSACDPNTRPADSVSCTPTQEACGELPLISQLVTLNTNCPTRCTPDPANNRYCLLLPF